MSERWKVAPVPIIGIVGMILRAVYNAEKTIIEEITLVLLFIWLKLLVLFTTGTFLHSCVNFYIT